MLNKNFINAVLYSAALNSSNKCRSYKTIDGTFDVDNYSINSLLSNIFDNFSNTKEASLNQGVFTFMLGSGETTPTIDDYTLESRVDESNFSISSYTVTNDLTDNASETVYEKCKRVLSQIWVYNGNAEITIKEIGLVCCSNYSSKRIMFDHTVLESPITVNNGDTFTIALTIGGKATATLNN